MNALPATAAPKAREIPISSLPFTITAPGTYVLTGNLQTNSSQSAINIANNIQGPVVLDLNGFSLTAPNADGEAIVIEAYYGSIPTNTYPITIKNGTISGGLSANPENRPFPSTEITVDNVTFVGLGLWFFQTSYSTVKNCTFQTGGIADYNSPGGNRYLNLTFINTVGQALFVGGSSGRAPSVLTLEDCEFANPAK
jgi:hypothetical protein